MAPGETPIGRRTFGKLAVAAGLGPAVAFGRSPAIHLPGPKVTCGVASGDVAGGAAVVWSRSDRPAKMRVEWTTNDAFRDLRRIDGPTTQNEGDFTGKTLLTGLPPGETIVYRVTFLDPDSPKVAGEPVVGRFRTPAETPAPIRFAWGGDVAGQGWGIDPMRGGMATFDAIRKADPHFFVHSGDHIYADNPISPGFRLLDGTIWRNIQTEETSKVAETIDEFRGRYRYNYLDEPFRTFMSEVALLDQWDDHEVLNNWYPGEVLDGDPRYRVKDVNTLAARARRAFLDYSPIRPSREDANRIYRVVNHGPNLDIFMLDQRSYRGANSANRQKTAGPETAFLGPEQVAWLKTALANSRARWKVVASDMPISLIIGDAHETFEGLANGNGPALGRELEFASILASIKTAEVRNVVWITADVHYAAAHRYEPSRARFTDFRPFWEFVAGPLHAGNFGPAPLDDTFGPAVTFTTAGPTVEQNSPPSDGHQYFGTVDIDRSGDSMTVGLHNRSGKTVHTVTIAAE